MKMEKYIVIGAVLAAGMVLADIAPVVNQARIAPGVANSGSTGNFDIKEGGGTYSRYAVMKVDLSGVSGTVDAATIGIKIKDQAAGNLRLFGLVDSVGNGWDWNTDMTFDELNVRGAGLAAPLFSSGLSNPNLVDLGTVVTVNDGSYPVVSFGGANLVSLMNADTDDMLTVIAAFDANANLGIRDTMANGSSIDYSVIPEPATLGLVAMAAVGMLGVRRFLAL